ncbi:MAG TPA: metal ABC transporter substrate-binding protein [Candidatus Limnocylindria bacterium]|jgi:ABC-type Zn uptake system ZnuABC Zn-binding protein ZnuA|nr:metal ABC transporter substrate-binding protein [Candidatus Limnocylindria bacterium]
MGLRARFLFAWVAFVAVPGLLARGDAVRPKILTSIPPLYCWAVNVAGDLASVENLLPADIGPHDYQFKPRDLKRLQAADLIVLNGLGLEDWFTKAIQANATPAPGKVIRVSDGLPQTDLIYGLPTLELEPAQPGSGHPVHEDHDHDQGLANPHLWQDPRLAMHGVTNILLALQRIDPAHAADYQRNATAYLGRLVALDAELRKSITGLGVRTVVTYHDAFPYFCRRYGIELAGVIEQVPGSDPSPRYLAELLKVIRARHVKVIFTEPQFNPRLAKRLADDLGIAVAELDVLETGALSPGSYEDGLRRNLRVLEQYLK